MHTKESLDPDDLNRPEWNSLLNNYSKHDIGEAYFKARIEQIGLHVENWGIDKRHEDENLIFDNKMDLRLWEPLDGQDDNPTRWPSDGFDSRLWNATVDTAGFDIPPLDVNEETINLDNDFEMKTWELQAVADVKTKASASWLGKFNLRHLAHYAEWADHYGAPVFVYMTMVDTDAESVGDQDFLTEITTDWDWELMVDHYDTDHTSLSYGELKDTARECDIVTSTFRAPDGNLVIEIADDARNNWDYLVEEVL